MAAQESTEESSPVASAASAIADPGPLGLAAFATTTFVLSCVNAGLFKDEAVVYGLAFAFGGVVQVLAGMWEFKKGNTFGATAFASYGGFWISFWWLTGHTDLTMGKTMGESDVGQGVGLFLLAWTIFTAYMFVCSLKTNPKLIAVFGVLTLTFLALTLSDLTAVTALGKVGGVLGIITALLAWFTSYSGIAASQKK